MGRWVLVLFILAMQSLVLKGQTSYMEKVQAYRDSMNLIFSDAETSILPDTELVHFHGLDFFAVDPTYRVKAKFKPIKNGEIVKMKTSGARTPDYKPYGTLKFKLNGKKCSLTLYQNADKTRPALKDYLLLAFTDKTNGFDTYGGGRYLEYHTWDVSSEMIIDFNYCYNPYCAYTTGYNCVIPPSENALEIEVKAGAKKYHE